MSRASVVIPARNEGRTVLPLLRCIPADWQVLVVVDDEHDNTEAPGARVVSTYGPGAAQALRYGIDHAAAPVIVTMCADGSDDTADLTTLVSLVERGATVACASRYMKGGHRRGGPWLARKLSRSCGWSLWLTGLGTHDASNLYKAYDAAWLRGQVIESRQGFTIGIELAAKARRAGLPVWETPTVWLDRTAGASHFRLAAWLPAYLRWWMYAAVGSRA